MTEQGVDNSQIVGDLHVWIKHHVQQLSSVLATLFGTPVLKITWYRESKKQ